MPTLEQALYDHELIVLRVLGEWMDLDLLAADKKSCVAALAEAFAGVNLELETQYLPPEEAAAFQALLAAGGRLPVATFSRDHGEVRLMGPGALEREEPWYDPVSPAEALWYRGFIYRNFQETGDGMVEFFYLPDEFLAQFPAKKAAPAPAAVQPVTRVPEPVQYEAGLRDAVDDLTTLLCLAQNDPLPLACYDEVAPICAGRIEIALRCCWPSPWMGISCGRRSWGCGRRARRRIGSNTTATASYSNWAATGKFVASMNCAIRRGCNVRGAVGPMIPGWPGKP